MPNIPPARTAVDVPTEVQGSQTKSKQSLGINAHTAETSAGLACTRNYIQTIHGRGSLDQSQGPARTLQSVGAHMVTTGRNLA